MLSLLRCLSGNVENADSKMHMLRAQYFSMSSIFYILKPYKLFLLNLNGLFKYSNVNPYFRTMFARGTTLVQCVLASKTLTVIGLHGL